MNKLSYEECKKLVKDSLLKFGFINVVNSKNKWINESGNYISLSTWCDGGINYPGYINLTIDSTYYDKIHFYLGDECIIDTIIKICNVARTNIEYANKLVDIIKRKKDMILDFK